MIFKIFIGHSHPVLKQMLLFTVAKTDFSFPIYQILQYLCLLKNENEMWTEEREAGESHTIPKSRHNHALLL